MKGNVCGHYVAIRPDNVAEEIEDGALKGFQLAAGIDENQRSREQAATTTGTVISIGQDAWIAFKSNKPWAKIGDRVVYVRHVAKIVDDEGNLDADGKPKKLFIMTDENILWNLDESKDNE